MTLTPVAPEASIAIDPTTPLLELPAQLLLAAAQFASKDETKHNLTIIQIECTAGGVVLRSVDGHRAFRCAIPRNLLDGHYGSEQAGEAALILQIPAAPLRKACASAHAAVIYGGMVQLLDSKRTVKEMRPITFEPTYEFPKLDTLWPTEFHYDPGRALGFDASYIESIAQVIKRLSNNGNMALSFNTFHTACVINADAEIPIGKYGISKGGETEVLNLEFLIMPVQMRKRIPFTEAERLVNGFNRKPADQRDGIRAELNDSSDSYAINFRKDKGLVFCAHSLAQAQAVMTYIAGA